MNFGKPNYTNALFGNNMNPNYAPAMPQGTSPFQIPNIDQLKDNIIRGLLSNSNIDPNAIFQQYQQPNQQQQMQPSTSETFENMITSQMKIKEQNIGMIPKIKEEYLQLSVEIATSGKNPITEQKLRNLEAIRGKLESEIDVADMIIEASTKSISKIKEQNDSLARLSTPQINGAQQQYDIDARLKKTEDDVALILGTLNKFINTVSNPAGNPVSALVPTSIPIQSETVKPLDTPKTETVKTIENQKPNQQK